MAVIPREETEDRTRSTTPEGRDCLRQGCDSGAGDGGRPLGTGPPSLPTTLKSGAPRTEPLGRGRVSGSRGGSSGPEVSPRKSKTTKIFQDASLLPPRSWTTCRPRRLRPAATVGGSRALPEGSLVRTAESSGQRPPARSRGQTWDSLRRPVLLAAPAPKRGPGRSLPKTSVLDRRVRGPTLGRWTQNGLGHERDTVTGVVGTESTGSPGEGCRRRSPDVHSESCLTAVTEEWGLPLAWTIRRIVSGRLDGGVRLGQTSRRAKPELHRKCFAPPPRFRRHGPLRQALRKETEENF
ncbi:Hypothetical predicted protein [Marmota monax]|uniref:Uncharacterized protein n=1 Tax=Marmota monax TaxID=9995 RepID=A0A5E4C7Q1_MARMO|nr:Hypothetical predicted protein [Marmota monax]